MARSAIQPPRTVMRAASAGAANAALADAPVEPDAGPDGRAAMTRFLRTLWRDDGGVTSIEYALIAMLIAVVIVGAVTAIGVSLQSPFTNVSDALK